MELPQLPSQYCATCVSMAVLAVLVISLLPVRLKAASGQLSFGTGSDPLTLSPSSLNFGNVPVGQSKTFQSVLTNNGAKTVTISSVSSNNSEFKLSELNLPLEIGSGIGIEITVTFSPTATGSDGGEVSVSMEGSSSPTVLSLSGTGVAGITAIPSSLSFGNIPVGSKSTLPLVLKNNGSSKVTLSSVKTTGTGFSVGGAQFPLTLTAGQSVSLDATFKPAAVGKDTGDAFVAGPSLNISLSGTGTGTQQRQLSVTPATLNFGNVAVGNTGTLTAGLDASGGTVTVTSFSSSSGRFSIPGVTFPLTVPLGKEVMLNVVFTPNRDGSAAGTLTFQSDATDSPTSEALSGTGTAPYVSLSWNASTSQDVSGYNVYRKSSSGSFAKLNSSLDTETSYTDSTVSPGATYYYATTSVNSSGQESTYSNQVEVVVP
jgi:hypothetical protein